MEQMSAFDLTTEPITELTEESSKSGPIAERLIKALAFKNWFCGETIKEIIIARKYTGVLMFNGERPVGMMYEKHGGLLVKENGEAQYFYDGNIPVEFGDEVDEFEIITEKG